MEKKKLLIADDSFEHLLLATAMLKNEYEVITAANGADAVEKAIEEKPSVILLDIMMPEMDGIHATLKLKNNQATKEIPIIMVTALSDSDSVLTSYEYGADHYITKPYAYDKLMKAINFVMKSREKGL